MKLNKKTVVLLICCAAVVLLTLPLLGADSLPFLKWWLAALVLGIGFFPLTARLFATFSDKGWVFSKAIGTALSGYLAFVLISFGIAPFENPTVILCTVIPMALCWILFVKAGRKQKTTLLTAARETDWNLILVEELLFLGLFLVWTYFAGCRPEAYGTEKFMDYGFMAAMMRDSSLPARDLWYSSAPINYYYGGQYYAVFLTRLTGTRIQETYNLMRTFVAGFSFVLPFSIAWHLMRDRKEKRAAAAVTAGESVSPGRKGGGALPYLTGCFAGAAVSLAGNMHYVLYGLMGSVFQLSGYADYWFPASTRYIGHNPLLDYDQCIHEFPSYSFVLGDLHAHVVNLLFVLCFIGILYAWLRKMQAGRTERMAALRQVLKSPHIWLLSLLLGIFQWTNYWDFAIYLVVGVIAFALAALRYSEKQPLLRFLLRSLMLVLPSLAFALPFNMHFQTMMQGFGLSPYHTPLYQLAILWALPAASVLLLLGYAIIHYIRTRAAAGNKTGSFFRRLPLSDLIALLLGICAIGLVLAPEVLYVRDIYEDGYARANTMFKFTYQAFLMFGISAAYALVRLLADVRKILVRIVSAFLIFLFVLTCGYFPYAVNCWFGDVFSKGAWRGLDATAFLENIYPEDAAAIRWLNENVTGNPVVLEADGDSYSDWERVSAMTGLPTVVGWFVHEWLWRNDSQDLVFRCQDVRDIYTWPDRKIVQDLILKYGIRYIFVGRCERESYPELNDELLQSLGEVVFVGETGDPPTYIIQIDETEW